MDMEPRLEKAIIVSGVSGFIIGGLAGIVSTTNGTDFGNSSVPVCTVIGYILNRKSGLGYAVGGVVSTTIGYKVGYDVSRFAYEMLR